MDNIWRPISPYTPGTPHVSGGPAISTSLTFPETLALGKLVTFGSRTYRTAEVGTAYGFSAIVMALAGAEVVTIDPHEWLPDSYEVAQRNVKEWGVEDRVVFARCTAESWPAEDEAFDGVFIDGDHSASHVRHDAALAKRIVRPGGWIAFHDYGEATCPGISETLDELWPDGPDQLTDTLFVVKP